MMEGTGLQLVAEKPEHELLGSEDIRLMEAIVTTGSSMQGKTVVSLDLRWRYGINLVAVARQGQKLQQRLKQISLAVGDILLLQGPEKALHEALPALGCLPLPERQLMLGQPRRVLLAVGLFGVGLVVAALGLLPVQVAFLCVAIVMVLIGLLSLRDVYASIDWPIIVLLGAMIPVGHALETTGGANLIAAQLLHWGHSLPPAMTLAVVLIGTMFLSDLVNNAAAALLVAPIAASLAQGMEVSADPFLMSVAIGASCAFLTPIGHQSNTLVMVPGGYRFGDYWRMGLPLEILIVVVGLPLIIWWWPFYAAQP
jgi:di/tricarboxylate transporter